MSVAIGDLGLDWSSAGLTGSQILAAGARFALRYSAGTGSADANTQFKLCKPGEIAAIIAAGCDFIANSEWYESRVTDRLVAAGHDEQSTRSVQGRILDATHRLSAGMRATIPDDHPELVAAIADAGSADGAADLAFWRSRGLNRGASVYCSWDASPATSQWAAVDAYLHNHNEALGGYYHVDAYAGTPYLRHALAQGLIRYGWRPNAGSWSNDGLPYQPDTSTAIKRASLVSRAVAATPAAIWQTGNYWFNNGADEDMLIRPNCGSHLQAASKPAPPPTESLNIMEWVMTMPGVPTGLTYQQFLAEIANAVIAQQVTNLQGTKVTLSYLLRAMDQHINEIESDVTPQPPVAK